MSDCKQKFLGLNSIGDLLEAFEKKIDMTVGDSKLFTLQLFKYVKDGDTVVSPNDEIYYDFNNSSIVFPNDDLSWNTLAEVIGALEENDLSNGSIYTSIRLQQGNSKAEGNQSWSKPIKISGVNGENGLNGAEFIFSYAIDGDYTSNVLKLLDEDGKREIYYKYRPSDNEEWSDPMIWAKYTTDGQDGKDGINGTEIHYRYYVTSVDDVDKNNKPIRPNDNVIWSETIMDVSKDYPYLWVRTQQTVAGEAVNDENWSDPKLLSKYGQDGTAPNYNITLYKYDNGYAKPDKPSMINAEDKEFESLDDFLAYNSAWVLTPELFTPMMAAVEPITVTENASTTTISGTAIEVSTFDEINTAVATATPGGGSVFIQLKNDIEIPSPIIVNEGDVHIHLNNKTIKAGTFKYDEQSSDTDSYVFWVKGGKLTINGNGVVESTEATYSMAVWSNGGDVDIYAGTYINHGDGCDLIYASARKEEETRIGGTVRIYGGVFKATSYKGVEAGTGNAHSALNIKNADRDVCTIEVYGGSFLGFDPSNNLSEPGVTDHSFLAPGVNATVDAFGNFVVIEENPIIELWWQCTVLIDGKSNKVISIGDVARYTALDGTALPGEYTKFKYKWFDTQILPEDFIFNPEDWNDTPDKDVITTPEASLWMVSAVVNGINSEGDLNIGEWSVPVKISGPRGPISYDYRTETLYKRGNLSNPAQGEWTKDVPKTNTTYPYIWAREMLSCYAMKYKDTPNADGTYDIVVDESIKPKEIEVYGEFRMTGIDGKNGIDGKDGNSSNNIKYSKSIDPVIIDKYYDKNYFISNVDGEITYNFELVSAAFEEGATFKFANVKGTSKFTTKELMPFIFKGESVTEFTCSQYDCFEIVCVKDDNKQVLVVIGGKF